jgi:outer membrane protein assembly factor BamB
MVATTLYLSYVMKQPKILFLVIIALLPLVLVSCISGGSSVSRGWAGTTFHDGIIYAGTSVGRVVAINSSTQSLEWLYTVVMPSSGMSCGQSSVSAPMYGTPIVDGDLVYIGTYSGQVLALNILARSQNLTFPQQRYDEWEWDCPIDNARSNAIVADLLVSDDAIYVSSSNGRVYSLDKEFGDQNWESDILDERQRKLWTSPVIQGDALYVSTLDGHIYVLSVETGGLSDWSFESDAGFASSPVIYEDTIFLGSFDRHLYAVGIGSDVPMWKFPQEKPASNWFWAAPIVNEGIVYAGCLDGKLYAINATTGKEIWSYMTKDQEGRPSPIISSPVLMDNLLIVTAELGTVYVFDLDAEIGDEAVPLETIQIGADVSSSFCAHDGLVYIRGENNQLYAVDIDKGEVSWNFDLTKEEE